VALAGFGNIKLDLRRAELPGGLTEFVAIGLFGNVEVIVPEALDVELDGFAIFGNLDHRPAKYAKARKLVGGLMGGGEEPLPGRAHPEDAYVSIRGFAVFGNVTVTVV
jgi:predicted membrane protein